jgi:hypothetical protein
MLARYLDLTIPFVAWQGLAITHVLPALLGVEGTKAKAVATTTRVIRTLIMAQIIDLHAKRS